MIDESGELKPSVLGRKMWDQTVKDLNKAAWACGPEVYGRYAAMREHLRALPSGKWKEKGVASKEAFRRVVLRDEGK